MNKHKQYTFLHLLVTFLLAAGTVMPLFGQSTQPAGHSFGGSDYQYFDLNCNVGSWEGYFAPSRWERTVVSVKESAPISGAAYAGGNGIVVIGRHPGAEEEWSIKVPVPGYLSFRLLPANAVRKERLRVVINDREQGVNLRSDGLYYSPYLRTGDRFALRIPAGETVYAWTKLLYHTNYSAVIVRPRAANVADRYVAVEADLIQRVVFPEDGPGTWPVFDRDGDLTTLDDQTELRSSGERFNVQYTDKVIRSETGFFLQRTFVIRENCSRGNWLKTSRRWVDLPIVAE